MKPQKGVTLVELLLVMGIATILLGLGGIAVSSLLKKDQLDYYVIEIKTSLYQAQTQSINNIPSGVYFEPTRFVLFKGDSFKEGDLQNQEELLPPTIRISSINLPNQSVTYENVSGYVKNFIPPASLNLVDQETGRNHLILINRLGIIEVQ
jgi:prepilin-type N-terminal cleavage/methylation domain-containing protein